MGIHITYKILEYDIGTEKFCRKDTRQVRKKTTQIDNDGYTEWLELMFPYIPIDIDMASFDNADFGGVGNNKDLNYLILLILRVLKVIILQTH